MQPIFKSWVVQIDITNMCKHKCIYCTRYLGHLDFESRYFFDEQDLRRALESLNGWPGYIGIMGGEPMLHPEFRKMVKLASQYVPREKLYLWTSGLPGSTLQDPRQDQQIQESFGRVFFNPHNVEQVGICRHQPLTIAIDEVVENKSMMWKLINNCWLPRLWSPAITNSGAYFCEVAAALDKMLYAGAHAWPVENGWWKRPPEAFQEQVTEICRFCGMCLPLERQYLIEQKEWFTPKLYEKFVKNGFSNLELKKKVRLFEHKLSNEEIIANSEQWYPANYRDDIRPDKVLNLRYKGILASLEPDQYDPTYLHLNSEEEFQAALDAVSHIDPLSEYNEYSFFYQGLPFNPLIEPYPFVVYGNEQENTFYWRCMLVNLKQFVSKDRLNELLAAGITKHALESLASEFRQEISMHMCKTAKALNEKYTNQDVYFWGAGQAYEYYKQFIRDVKPQNLLVDPVHISNNIIDEISVCAPNNLTNPKRLPGFVFVKRENAVYLLDNIQNNYKHLFSKLHVLILQ